jgi:hypothetical protein
VAQGFRPARSRSCQASHRIRIAASPPCA